MMNTLPLYSPSSDDDGFAGPLPVSASENVVVDAARDRPPPGITAVPHQAMIPCAAIVAHQFAHAAPGQVDDHETRGTIVGKRIADLSLPGHGVRKCDEARRHRRLRRLHGTDRGERAADLAPHFPAAEGEGMEVDVESPAP